jgi:8-oxo-dGTP pyrophosphatase MutT (NUDIX family)
MGKINEGVSPWLILDKTDVYDNNWISITEYNVKNPNGGIGIYGQVHFKNKAIGVLVLDKDNFTYLVGQYRFPLKKYSWEIPEGGGDLNVEAIESAKRELMEETGIVAHKWTKLMEMDIRNSVTDESSVCFVAQDFEFFESEPEETEELQVKKVHFSELLEMVLEGEIRDSITVAAVLKVKILMDQGIL